MYRLVTLTNIFCSSGIFVFPLPRLMNLRFTHSRCLFGLTFYEQCVIFGVKSKDGTAVGGHQMSWGKRQAAHDGPAEDVLQKHFSIPLHHEQLIRKRKNSEISFFCRKNFIRSSTWKDEWEFYQALQEWHWHNDSGDSRAVIRPGQTSEECIWMISLLFLWQRTSVGRTGVTFHWAAPLWAPAVARWWLLASLRFCTESKDGALLREEFGNHRQGQLGDWQSASLAGRCLPLTPVRQTKDSLGQGQWNENERPFFGKYSKWKQVVAWEQNKEENSGGKSFRAYCPI